MVTAIAKMDTAVGIALKPLIPKILSSMLAFLLIPLTSKASKTPRLPLGRLIRTPPP
jgi:uncharacterized membrane protein